MKKIFSILFALVLVASLGLAIGTSVAADPGTTYYVSNTGSDDTGDGSDSNPWKTIQHAVGQVASGDTIVVAAGAYDTFTVADKANINIISTEGATVTTATIACNYSLGLELPVCVWVMAMVEDSENINIEGIDFDGTAIIDKEAVIAILYLDSTGRISDLTVENVVGNTSGAGVAIIGDVDTSTVEITRSTISNNDIGIWVLSDSTQEAHFNNVVGNTYYGVANEGGVTVDATQNWWGDASGPYHESLNPGGMGNGVSDNVDFEPWLESEIVAAKTETVTGGGTVYAKEEADTEVDVDGTATVTVFRYPANPGGALPTDFIPLKYIDVYVPDTSAVTEIEIRLYYTDNELSDEGIEDESLLQLLWWDGAEWKEYSLTEVNTESNYVWGKIRTEGTEPSLDFLEGGKTVVGRGTPEGLPSGVCFIATAAYGTDTAKELDILREFRDEVLLPNSLGAEFVSLYYKTSPPLANFISQHEILRTVVRVGFVDPIVKILTWTHNLWSA